MNWETPKTNWQAQNVPTTFDFNRIEKNIEFLKGNVVKSFLANNNVGYMLFENNILINWGRTYIEEDKFKYVEFELGYSSSNTSLFGVVLTGAESNAINTSGYNHRNDFYVLGADSKGMRIYNDGNEGTVNWLVIGLKVS